MPERPGPLGQFAGTTDRRGFLARVSGVLALVAGGSAAAELIGSDPALGYTNFCGHTWTTGNCPHPTGLPRVDRGGKPLRAHDGHPVDDLGRPVDSKGHPVDTHGKQLLDPDGRLLPSAPRTPVCHAVAERFDLHTTIDGSWYRCCGGQVRRLMDCCAHTHDRINGDEALDGYCYKGRKVFCVIYHDTGVKC
jgi:hypothetical protein